VPVPSNTMPHCCGDTGKQHTVTNMGVTNASRPSSGPALTTSSLRQQGHSSCRRNVVFTDCVPLGGQRQQQAERLTAHAAGLDPVLLLLAVSDGTRR
jgi:hypothetical protein